MTIQPRTLKGFRDHLPSSMMAREQLIDTARRVYRSFGFCPIDTPALEYLDILQGKGSDETDKQLYKFVDNGGRHVGMRFDLTVPLARFAAQHAGSLGIPFKRYHIAPVWRGENTQRGRYREFMQCDFDTIGTESVAADIETILVINALLVALGIDRFRIQINHRGVLSGTLEKLELADTSTLVLRALDKLAKVGREKVAKEMVETAGATPRQADQILELAGLSGTNADILAGLQPIIAGNDRGQVGADRLSEIVDGVLAAGVPEERIRLDVSIARGLDYYTGTVVETLLNDLPDIGSVCSGGRYDDLAGVYTKQRLPGIGASLGLDRLLAALEELKLVSGEQPPADVLITFFDRDRLHDYVRIASQIRNAGFSVELYPDPKKIGQQLKYADRKRFPIAVIAGENELAANTCQVKNLYSGQSVEVSLESEGRKLAQTIAQVLKEITAADNQT